MVVVKSKVWPKKYQIFNSLDLTIECIVCVSIFIMAQVKHYKFHMSYGSMNNIIIIMVSTFTILNLQERVRYKGDRWNIQCQVCVRHLTADCWITVKLIAGCCVQINCNKLLRHLTFNRPRNQAHSSNHRQQGIHPATAVQTARAEFNSGFFISSLFIPLFCANNTGYLESIMIYGQPHTSLPRNFIRKRY